MVRAILAGTKTQTRRVVKPAPQMVTDRKTAPWDGDATALLGLLSQVGRPCPYGQPGYRLWVRETWQVARETIDYETGGEYDVFEWTEDMGDPRPYLNGDARFGTKAGLFYAADGEDKNPGAFYNLTGFDNKTVLRPKEINWRPSIHMPRWANRITLEVTGVRVERLQDISEADAMAEGCARLYDDEPGYVHRDEPDWSLCPQCGGTRLYTAFNPTTGGALPDTDCEKCDTYVKRYQHLWESINGPDSWAANPWVWVVEFKHALRAAA